MRVRGAWKAARALVLWTIWTANANQIERARLEMAAKIAKRREDEQFSGAAFEFRLLEFPGGGMRNENGVESHLQGGIDVAARAVADHPPVRLHNFELADHAVVCAGVFLDHDFDRIEI